MIHKKQIIALALVAIMVASAGCAGWGTDGPADNDPEQSNDSDDLEQEQNETDQGDDSDGTTDGDSSGGGATDGDASDGDPDSDSGDSDTSDSPDSSSDDTTESDSSDSSKTTDERKGTSDASPQGSDPGDGTSTDGDSDTSDDTSDKKDTTDEKDEKDETDDKSETPSDSDDETGDNDTDDTDEKSDDSDSDPEQDPSRSEDDSQGGDNETPTDPDEDETDNGDNNETPTDPDPEPEGNTVTIDVRDLETDEPVNIPVRLNGIGSDYDETVSATDGMATFKNVPNGDYEVKSVADDWWTEYGSVHEITVDGDTNYVLGVNDPLPRHTLTVTVTDAQTGEPVEGATVSGVGDRHPSGGDILIQGETNANGVATITAPESGFILDVSAEGYEPDTQQVNVESDTDASFEVQPTSEPETHTLTTTVTDSSGNPLSGAYVAIVTYDGGADVASATADENGQATFDLEDGSYEVVASHEGYAQPSDNRLVEINGEDTTFEVALEPTEQQYAPASAVDVESVKHGGAEPFTDHDQVTISNTHDELPLDVSGWVVSVSDRTPEMTIGDDTVLAPGETHTIVLDAEDKMLNASGGVLQLYATDGSPVMEYSYVGSPSAPYLPPENGNESGNGTAPNETAPNETAAAV